ncbi:hypothetical protein RN001_012354 [Aquatica leii]|uniref:Uncharacterized protein n=1 Tax=Aquatica leii TaxID=1421715 RepID=A0AAN7PU87_9COLE|nr:hypothetical protein RN001_012354 [Aquatica leii]
MICKRSDPNLNECLKEAIQKALSFIENGIDKFRIPSMQPIKIKTWTVQGTDILPFEQHYQNGQLYNYASSTIDQVQATITDNDFSISINGHLPMAKFVGQYKIDNAIFYGQNLTGNGTIVYIEYANVFVINMTGRVNRNGDIPILQITSTVHNNTIEDLDINLDTFHIEQSAKHSDHLNKHWKVIVDELREGYLEMYAVAFQNIANSIFSQLDYDKLFPK